MVCSPTADQDLDDNTYMSSTSCTPSRSFLVVKAADCTFITNRQVGKLSTVTLTLEDHTVTLEAEGAQQLKFDLQHALKDPKVVHTK